MRSVTDTATFGRASLAARTLVADPRFLFASRLLPAMCGAVSPVNAALRLARIPARCDGRPAALELHTEGVAGPSSHQAALVLLTRRT